MTEISENQKVALRARTGMTTGTMCPHPTGLNIQTGKGGKYAPAPLPHPPNISGIPQFDGNCSILSSSSSKSSMNSSAFNTFTLENSWFSQPPENSIPVITGFRPPRQIFDRPPPARRVVCRDNKCIQALSLPSIMSYNVRSIWGKLNNLADDIKEKSGQIVFLCEIWEKSQCKKHKQKIEELLEMKNIQYISTTRPGAATHSDKFLVSKLNINIPKPLEIVWALLRPGATHRINQKGDSVFILFPTKLQEKSETD